jgi:hypothetical protein
MAFRVSLGGDARSLSMRPPRAVPPSRSPLTFSNISLEIIGLPDSSKAP